jgi:hypothetical protein
MSFVFVVDHDRKPLAPVHPGRARFLLTAGHAAVLRRYPFTIILKESHPDAAPHPLRVKLDPGSQTTGMAVVDDTTGQVVWAAELAHRGDQVQAHLDQRRGCRRSRRQRHTRYRPPRFQNRRRQQGWLPPSLESRLANILTWVARLQRACPIAAISMELVKFDMQLMQHAEIIRTGDIVRATVPASSSKAGSYVGRIAIRASGSCNLKTGTGTIQGIHYRFCQPLHRGDGYAYTNGRSA